MTNDIYRAFAERLADKVSSETRATTEAGIATLTLYNSIKGATFARDVHGPELAQIAHTLRENSDDNPVRASLLTLINVMPFWSPEHRVTRSATYAALRQYGEALADEAEWNLAKVVFVLVAIDAELDHDFSTAAQGQARAGMAYRVCADWDNSEACYARGIELGVKAGDLSAAFRARGGQACNKRDRGDLPGAERQLLSLIRSATYLCPEVVVRLMGSLATVVNTAGQYERAIELGRRTLELAKDDQRLRTKALVDIANFLTDYGLPTVAGEALHIVVATAPERHVRNIALLNLFLLAANAGDSRQLDSLREQLRDALLTPKQRTLFALWDAQGLRNLGRFDHAQETLAVARQLAEQHNFFQLSFEAEAETKRLDDATAAVRSLAPEGAPVVSYEQMRPIPAGVRRAVNAVHSLGASMTAKSG